MHVDLNPIKKSATFCNFLGVSSGADINFELLGHGEYNLNYVFNNPATEEKLVLRIPMGSQMHLSNQVRYEFEALRLLEPSGRTPIPYYIDDTKTVIPYGFLVMSFISGRSLRYASDLAQAAECLADIHNLKIPEKNHLLRPENPLAAVLEECFVMSAHYLNSDLGSADVKLLIFTLLEQGQKIVAKTNLAINKPCLINTELNSGNFLVNDNEHKTSLVDWEKPLYACVGQDLGHFLAPTTTLWKTDTILTAEEIKVFMESYCHASDNYSDPDILWQETLPFFVMTCLRGVTWCSMAWLEYQNPNRVLKDMSTFEKIKTYITPEFLEKIYKDYLHE